MEIHGNSCQLMAIQGEIPGNQVEITGFPGNQVEIRWKSGHLLIRKSNYPN